MSALVEILIAQRRPARPSRQLPVALPAVMGGVDPRSTKAGSAEPATPDSAASSRNSTSIAQRRPARPSRQLVHSGPIKVLPRHGSSLNEGRLGRAGNSRCSRSGRGPLETLNEGRLGRAGNSPLGAVPRTCLPTLNEGRLGRAGNSRDPFEGDLVLVERSTKAGSAEPATPDLQLVHGRLRRGGASLNEGRLGRAGNSRRGSAHVVVRMSSLTRSTKAGSAEPATLHACPPSGPPVSESAQRRPARPSRQLSRVVMSVSRASALAQRRPARPSRQLVLPDLGPLLIPLRSTKAGSAEPATRPPRSRPASHPTPLNEGRLGRAGNSNAGQGREGAHEVRSTKAGSAEPATQGAAPRSAVCRTRCSLNEGRLGRAGNSPQLWFVRLVELAGDLRSTKAGSAEPATPGERIDT